VAKVYVATDGDDSRSYAQAQVESTPWLTPAEATSSATAADTVELADGTYNADASGSYGSDAYHKLVKGLIFKAKNRRQAILTGDSASYAVRLSSTLPASALVELNGVVVDGASSNSGSGSATALDVGVDASDAWDFRSVDSHYICGNNYAITINQRHGIQLMTGDYITGSPAIAALSLSSSVAAVADQIIKINSLEMDVTASDTSFTGVLTNRSDDGKTYALTFQMDSPKITMRDGGFDADMVAIDNKAENGVITNPNITIIESASNTKTHFGILNRGMSGTTVSVDPWVIGGLIVGDVRKSYLLAHGQSTTASNISGGGLSGTTVIGKKYDGTGSDTPHNILFGMGTDAKGYGLKSLYGYVGILFSLTTAHYSSGHLVVDANGPHYYGKGATGTIDKSIAVHTGEVEQTGHSMFAANAQGATDTPALTYKDCVAIVADISNFNAVASNYDANQGVTYEGGLVFVDESVDLSTTDLFAYNQAGGAANNTIADFNTNMSTDWEAVKLPTSAIRKLAAAQKAVALAATMSSSTGIAKSIMN